jgi:hypothetical protein
MLTPARHLVQQRNMLLSLGSVAAGSLVERFRTRPGTAFTVPGPELSLRLPAPSAALIDDFLRHTGGSIDAATIPPQLFPQWGLPVALRALRGSGFPLVKMLNGGCRLEMNEALRRDRDLTVRARLLSVNDDGRRAVLCQRIVTEQEGAANALVADVYGVIVAPAAGRSHKQPSYLPDAARELERWQLERDAGLRFALLTGDFNPLHWLRPYAKMMGFGSTILHGFAAMARAYAGLSRSLAPRRLRVLDVRFVRPITLPAELQLFVDGDRVFVGVRGQPLFLTGTFAT